MGKKVDLSGQRFNRLLVISDSGDRANGGSVLWNCICDCGNTAKATASSLRNGDSFSCGCYNREKSRLSAKDLSGKKFGKWTAMYASSKRLGESVGWVCQCECGETRIVPANTLLAKRSLSCGCYNRERTSESHTRDLAGQRFTRLTVVERLPINEHTKEGARWRCVCECGKIVELPAGRLRSGMTQSCGCLQRESASRASWIDGRTTEDQLARGTKAYREWRKDVIERDGNKCVVCKGVNDLCGHHLDSFLTHKERRTDTENGVCLCRSCHMRFHRLYGTSATIDDFIAFFNEKSYE